MDTKNIPHDWLFAFVVVSVVLGFFGVAAIVALTTLDKVDHDIFMILIGVVGTKFSTVIDYFVGSSRDTSDISKKSFT